jgi:hypothetical protein
MWLVCVSSVQSPALQIKALIRTTWCLVTTRGRFDEGIIPWIHILTPQVTDTKHGSLHR